MTYLPYLAAAQLARALPAPPDHAWSLVLAGADGPLLYQLATALTWQVAASVVRAGDRWHGFLGDRVTGRIDATGTTVEAVAEALSGIVAVER